MENEGKPLVNAADAVLQLALHMLGAMERTMRGEAIGDELYTRLFGNKEGLVQQLQRLCDIVSDAQALRLADVTQRQGRPMDEEEQALIRHYVAQFAQQYARANADDA